MLRYHNLPQRSPEQTVVIGTRVDNHQFMSQRSSGLSTVSGHELLSSTSSHQSTFPNAETPAPGRQHSVIRPVTVLRLQCMLYTFVLGCLRFLPSVSSQLHTQRGSHALCVQCQALYCGPRAKAGSPSFFRPIEIDPERLVLVRILINSPDSASTTIPHMNRKKRRLNNPTINHPLHEQHDSSRQRLQQESKIDDQGRLTNRDRSLTIRTAGPIPCSSPDTTTTVVSAKRLTVHLDADLEAFLYVFTSPSDVSLAVRQWLDLSRSLSQVQLQCFRVVQAIRVKYCNSGQAFQIDPAVLRQFVNADSSLAILVQGEADGSGV